MTVSRIDLILFSSQDLAEHLVVHGHCLSSRDHKDLSSLFNLGQQSSRWAMDRRVALAMANLDIPQNWNVLGSHSGDGESRIFSSCLMVFPAQISLSKAHSICVLLHNNVYTGNIRWISLKHKALRKTDKVVMFNCQKLV